MNINSTSFFQSLSVSSFKESVFDSFLSPTNQKIALVALVAIGVLTALYFTVHHFFLKDKSVGVAKKLDADVANKPNDAGSVPATETRSKLEEDIIEPLTELQEVEEEEEVEEEDAGSIVTLDKEHCLQLAQQKYSVHPNYKGKPEEIQKILNCIKKKFEEGIGADARAFLKTWERDIKQRRRERKVIEAQELVAKSFFYNKIEMG